MIPDRHSVDYQINLETLHEMEELVPMTLYERNSLRSWVHSGHDPEANPWGYFDADGELLNFIQAFRLEHGYSKGPWDYWKGLDIPFYSVIYKQTGSDLVLIEDL